jgi:phage portal protein BeeE
VGLLSWAARIFTGRGGRGEQILDAVYRARRGDPPKRGTKEFLQTYEASPWVRAVVSKISQHVGETVWQLEGLRGKLDDHLMLRTLRVPNSTMPGLQLMALAQQSLETVGDAFLLKERNGLGAPVGLWYLPAHWIAELPTPERRTYCIAQGGAQEELPASEVLWVRDPSVSNPYGRGSGVAMALADEIGTYEYASKHAQGLFFNRAMPDVVVMDPGAKTEEIARHEQHWNNRLQGFWRAFKPYFANRELKFWQPQQMNFENLTLVPMQKYERDTIIQCWGMPPEQLGIVESSNRATADASDYIFEKRVIRPRREMWRAYLQAFLAPEYDPRLVVKYMDTVPTDKEHALNVAKAAPYTRTVDEWRECQCLPPLGGVEGSARFVPLQGYLTTTPLDVTMRPQAAPGGKPPAGDAEKPGPPA